MQQIRYKQRICMDQKKIEALLLQTKTGVVGMASSDFPYAVPVNYVWFNGSIYFHGMGSGKKESILAVNPPVCFTIYELCGVVPDPAPCHADTAYISVMVFGNAEKVTDSEETALALQQILEKYMPKYYSHPVTPTLIEKYRSSHDENPVSVYRITPQEMTAKENSAEPDQLFSLGAK